MRFGQGVLLLHMLLALMAGSAVAATSEPIGSTVVVVNRVTAEIARDIRTLQLGDDVRQNEVIEVSTDGLSELKLRDDTKLALGPGSRLLLDKFVYDGERTSGSIAINLIKGAFRFATGLAAKPSYVIRVPNASITVRGTIFDVYIQQNHVIPQNNGVWLLLHEGSVRVCSNRGMCRFLHEPGKLIRITDGGDVGSPSQWTALPGRQNIVFDNAFPFVVRPPRFHPAPIFTREAILLGRFPRSPNRPPNIDSSPSRDKGGGKASQTGPNKYVDTKQIGKRLKHVSKGGNLTITRKVAKPRVPKIGGSRGSRN